MAGPMIQWLACAVASWTVRIWGPIVSGGHVRLTCTPYKLQPLNDYTCWEIIKRYSRFEYQHYQERLEKIGLDIAKKCGGVALAAQALGYMLKSKDLAKGHNIAEDDLVHQWIALGFIKPSKGKEYIRQLLGWACPSFKFKTSGDHMERYTMHDLVHDLAALIVGDELIVAYVASKNNKAHSQKYCRYASVTKYDHATRLSNALPSKVRALHFSDRRKLDLSCGAFSFAKCLHILDFSGCFGILLPASIGQLKQLKYLTAAPQMQNEYLNLDRSAHISGLSESIGKLGSLRYLGLSGCSEISKLPESFGDLKFMVHLNMSAIPESLCGLMHLQYLNLSSCRYIRWLPEAIGSLVNLQYLNMSFCGVKEFPKLLNLLHLDLTGCYIEKGLAAALHGLTAIQYLDMSNVWCTHYNLEKEDLPVTMRNLTNLKALKLEYFLGGRFVNLNFIGTLTNLEHLDLSWNTFQYLPESIGNLKTLHTLNLKDCLVLETLPESIGCATGLKSVLLDGCQHKLMDQASSLLHYSLTLPLFKVRADDISAHSNLHMLEGENTVEEARRLNLLTKQNLLSLKLVWNLDAYRHLEDEDLLGQLVPPMSLKNLILEGYSSLSFSSWLMSISHHLPNLNSIALPDLPACSNLPPLRQLPYLESLHLWNLPKVSKIDGGICGGKGAFLRLAKFIVLVMKGLEEWNSTCLGEDGVEEFMFPMLDRLKVSKCPKLRLKSCPSKCREFIISQSNRVISSLEEVQTSSDGCNSTPTATTSLAISKTSQHDSFRLFHHFPALQEGIQQLSSLKSLDLHSCDSISALPEWLSGISSLKRLVINHCRSIRSLPARIQLLNNLEQLVIYGNQELQ
ncbi:hypothetical protein SETIT_8G156000v2 [Setaria italica]|uniref:Uncharacterized protein n=1 Tax=Setaria italica TaxID=4555 RepID=A0A368S8D3_SETIT|nr:hypothetical protein SETIT_8G156000v2 [Setaria italica]